MGRKLIFLALALPLVVGVVVLAGLRPWHSTPIRKRLPASVGPLEMPVYCMESQANGHWYHLVATTDRVTRLKPGDCASDPLFGR